MIYEPILEAYNELMSLNEGLVFLKNSERIKSLIKKIKTKTVDIKSKELKNFLSLLQRRAVRFEKFESDYKKANKEERIKIKTKYYDFVLKNKSLVDKLNDESFKKLLIVLGAIGLTATIVATIFGLNELFFNKDNIKADDLNNDDLSNKVLGDTNEERRELLKARKYNNPPEESKHITYGKEYADSYANAIASDKIVHVTGNTPNLVGNPDFKNFISLTSKEHGVDPKIIHAIIKQESDWNCKDVSYNKNGTRDMGLMQLNSAYHDYYIKKFWKPEETFDPMDPEDNVTMGIKYFAHLLKYYKGNTDLAIKAYNAGPTSIDAGIVPASTIEYLKIIKRGMA